MTKIHRRNTELRLRNFGRTAPSPVDSIPHWFPWNVLQDRFSKPWKITTRQGNNEQTILKWGWTWLNGFIISPFYELDHQHQPVRPSLVTSLTDWSSPFTIPPPTERSQENSYSPFTRPVQSAECKRKFKCLRVSESAEFQFCFLPGPLKSRCEV